MTVLILGLVVWTVAHLLKRAAPGVRGGIAAAVGDGPSRGVMALLILVGLVLIVIGYRRAPVLPVYDPPAWGIHLNNPLMLVAVALLVLGHSKSRARGWLRHPMLTAVVVWAVAHLLVNGDVASLVLFGWLGIWALVAMLLINAREPVWTRPAPGTLAGDVRFALIAVVAFVVIVTVHTWLGYWPFPG